MYKKDSIRPLIIQCMIMRLIEKESMDYLKDKVLRY